MVEVLNHPVSEKRPDVSSAGAGPGSLSQISCGNAALAQKLIYEIMALYGSIIQLQQQQKTTLAQLQGDQAEAEANATISAGEAAGIAGIVAGFLTIGGAIAGFALSNGAGQKADSEKYSTSMKESEDLEDQVKPLKAIDGFAGKDPETMGLGAEPSDDVKTRIAEIKGGQYAYDEKDADAVKNTEQAVGHMKRADDDDWDNFQKTCQDRSKDMSEQLNTKARDREAITNRFNYRSKLAEGMITQAGTVSQGLGRTMEGKYSANATSERVAGQMSGSAAGDFGQAMTKAYEAQNYEIQILDAIRRAAQTN